MKNLNTQKGFTLVELAIVMTIIGLLIGGILKGQELMQNARVTATIAQVKAIEAATTTFRDKFEQIPGDMPNASTKLTGCNANCNPLAANAGDGVIGSPTYTAAGGWAAIAVTASNTAPAAVGDETWLFWQHLSLANLIGGVTSSYLNTAAIALQNGITHPSAKVGGGFIAAYSNGATPPPGGFASAPSGTILILAPTPGTAMSGTNAAAAAGSNPLLATRAAQIDRKMDDGNPQTGYVQAYGIAANCTGTAAAPAYLESSTSSDCGLIFKIQG